jgi:hypothetical protein
MKYYHISYDLRNKEKNYEDLTRELASIGESFHILGSTWFVATPKSAAAIKKQLLRVIDPDDGLIITSVSREIEHQALDDDISAWEHQIKAKY